MPPNADASWRLLSLTSKRYTLCIWKNASISELNCGQSCQRCGVRILTLWGEPTQRPFRHVGRRRQGLTELGPRGCDAPRPRWRATTQGVGLCLRHCMGASASAPHRSPHRPLPCIRHFNSPTWVYAGAPTDSRSPARASAPVQGHVGEVPRAGAGSLATRCPRAAAPSPALRGPVLCSCLQPACGAAWQGGVALMLRYG